MVSLVFTIMSVNTVAQTQVLSRSIVSHPLTGEKLEFSKVYDSKTNRTVVQSNGSIRSMKTLDSLVEIKRQQEFRHYGRVGTALRKYVDQPSQFPDTGIEVTVQLKYPFYKQLDPFRHTEEEMLEQSRKVAAMKPVMSVEDIQKKYGIGSGEIEAAGDGDFRFRINRQRLEMLRNEEGIVSIDEFTEPKPTALSNYAPLDFRLIAWSAFNPASLPAGCRGEGINVATAEDGVMEHTWNCLGVNASQVFPVTPSIYNYAFHSTATFASMVYASPGATHYHTSRDNGPYTISGQAYRLTYNIKAMSKSWGECPSARDKRSALMDEFINLAPYTLFCNPSGNDGPDARVAWQCYNHLNVGSSVHTNLSHFEPAGYTSTKNPTPEYAGGPDIGGDATVGDRELPHVLTPGASPIPEGWFDDCLGYNPEQGTSFSAPVAVGIVADILSASKLSPYSQNFHIFNYNPELIRAIMMLTAQDCDGRPYQSNDRNSICDGRDGTGVVSVTEACRFARDAEVNIIAAQPRITGYHVYGWYPGDLLHKIPVRIPASNPGNDKKLRVVLTWNSVTNADTTPIINTISDLDLIWENPGHFTYSATWNNNVEVIEVPWDSVVPGSICTLTIKSYHDLLRFPPGIKQSYSKYAIVWDWVKTTAGISSEPASPPVLEPYPDQTTGTPSCGYPANNDTVLFPVKFRWYGNNFSDSSVIQLGNSSGYIYNNLVLHKTRSTFIEFLQPDKRYYWRIGAKKNGSVNWSSVCTFYVIDFPIDPPQGGVVNPVNLSLSWLTLNFWGYFPTEITTFTVQLWNGTDTVINKSGLPGFCYDLTESLDYDKQYSWRVGAEYNGKTYCGKQYNFTTSDPPAAPPNPKIPARNLVSFYMLIGLLCLISVVVIIRKPEMKY